MTDNKVHNLFLFCIFLSIFTLFCYFRLKPIQYQTVPYTYDQGRDFLKAQEIVRDKNITFIGPTTGIEGVFHGVWWFYALIIPFIITNGNPISFYYFVFFLSLAQIILFTIFLKKEFNFVTALFFGLITTSSPYFTSVSFFPSNSILTLPFILLMLSSSFYFFKTKAIKYLFLIFLSLGFVFESELAFGLFIIPAYIATIALTRNLKFYFGNKIKALSIIIGLIIPILPRLLFEVKNHFTQTQTILHFLINPTKTNSITLRGALNDRFTLFSGYFKGLFFQNNRYITYFAIVLILLGVLLLFKKLKKTYKRFSQFCLVLLLVLFLMTLIYHNNFFWGNYLEGLPYFYLVLMCVIVYAITSSKNMILKAGTYLLLIIIFLFTSSTAYSDFKRNRGPDQVGLRVQQQVVDYIYSKENNQDFCVIIYTPPVNPFTYHYLFDYNFYARHKKNPHNTYVNNSCWYIIEADDNISRRAKWIEDNVSIKGEKTDKYQIKDLVLIFKFTKK